MKKIQFIVALCLALVATQSHATENWTLGGRAGGFSGAASTFSDVWAVRNNQAGIAKLEGWYGGLYFDNSFLIPEISVQGLAAVYGFKKSSVGIDVSSYGWSVYRENKVGLSYAMMLSKTISVGVQLNYFEANLDPMYGSRGNLTAEVGFRAELSEKVTLGVHLANPTRSQFITGEKIPTILKSGLQFTPTKKLVTAIEVEKDIVQKMNIKGGAEYRVKDFLFLRIGAQSYRRSLSFGIGFKQEAWSIDLASQYDPFLGLSPKIGVQIHP